MITGLENSIYNRAQSKNNHHLSLYSFWFSIPHGMSMDRAYPARNSKSNSQIVRAASLACKFDRESDLEDKLQMVCVKQHQGELTIGMKTI